MKTNTKISRHVPLNDGYDECLVVGPSPVAVIGPSEWPTSGGYSLIIKPIEFGENIIMPADYVTQNFAVTPPPEPVVDTPTYADQPTPEQVFAAHAKAKPPVIVRPEPEIAKRIVAKKPRA